MMNCDRYRQLFLKLMESVMNCIRFPQHGSKQMKTAQGKGLGIALIVSVILSIFSMSTMSQAIEPRKFPDVPEKSWYASDLNFITSDARRILEGSSNGNFYPKNTLSVEQFLKCVVVAANQRPSAVGGYWAQPFIDKALQLGIITSSQFKAYRTGITRGEMAVIIRSAFEIMTHEKDPVVDISTISKRMSDYALIPNNQQESVCFAYSLGILTGMPDGKFHPEGILSRAEAVAVMRRVIDPTARIKPATTGEQTDGDQTGGDTDEIWSDAEFQAFMSTDEWKQYLNPNTIAGMKDGVLLFQNLKKPDGTEETISIDKFIQEPYVLPEPLYSKYYEITKTLGYYAKKYEATVTVSYTDYLGGFIEYDMSSEGGWKGYTPNLCFRIRHNKVEIHAPDLLQAIPTTKNHNIELIWEIGELFDYGSYEEAYKNGDISSFDYSQRKYTSIFRQIANIMLHGVNGDALSDFVEKKYDSIITNKENQFVLNDYPVASGLSIFAVYPRYTDLLTF